MKNIKDYTGLRFGRVTVLSQSVGHRYTLYGVCVCDCGVEKIIRISHLVRGKIVSCGCSTRERIAILNKKHGLSKTSMHNIWKNIKVRCKDKSNKNYGGRGISICDKWDESFEAFLQDMGPRPSNKHSIDRIDNNGNYEPSNCRWATAKEQANNKRKAIHPTSHKDGKKLTFNGVTKSLYEWGKDLNGGPTLVGHRLNRGWDLQKALTTPKIIC